MKIYPPLHAENDAGRAARIRDALANFHPEDRTEAITPFSGFSIGSGPSGCRRSEISHYQGASPSCSTTLDRLTPRISANA